MADVARPAEAVMAQMQISAAKGAVPAQRTVMGVVTPGVRRHRYPVQVQLIFRSVGGIGPEQNKFARDGGLGIVGMSHRSKRQRDGRRTLRIPETLSCEIGAA